ncbi:D-alanyl-D-alanine carboxypeptidase family protein [Ruminococcus gauvreauii]|uniref:serine-type D-Ala-D-Ala carboxypeptidase n=1 Tax=Ruminococcus gauvreauii TaxID=438033 RepID=A0ABY5VGI3_9FIRM|nr:D-alanyl-D-alanine carboxypeptidase family protein [Ruminococcus gauvreauii]UWP59714.1 D-alanyl-D-alanine carboxypeptidase [Ruminococcus gauvreauii]
MKKRIVLMGVLLAVIWGGQAVYAQEEPADSELYARSACLMDADSGRVLYEKDGEEKRPNASTTKIMTCILALENGNPDDTVTATKRAAGQPKVHLGVHEGDQFRLNDLLYSLMLESHNDSAVMIAEHIAGSVEDFAGMMNQKAQEIGCENTYFITPNGLDDQNEQGVHGTTAQDLARIMRYCIMQSPKREEFLAITQTASYTFWNMEETVIYNCYNHNAFLSMMEGALSGKTGFTADAGYCYVGALEQDGKTFIVSLLACGWPNNKSYKWSDTKKLMTYGLEHYSIQDVLIRELPAAQLEVLEGQHGGRLSEEAVVPLSYRCDMEQQSLKVLLGADEEVQVEKSLPDALQAPVKAGTVVGKVSYLLDGEVLKTYPVYADDSVKKIDFIWCFDIIKQKYLMRG